jgi:hypothetical protein
MGQVDKAWIYAAACETQVKHAPNATVKRMYESLRDSWIRIGNEGQLSGGARDDAKRLDGRG